MQEFMGLQLVAAAVVLLVCSSALATVEHVDDSSPLHGSLPQMPFYHRFSQQMKENAEKSGAKWSIPALNTPAYHQLLLLRDLVRHGRQLSSSQSALLTFYLGNSTTFNPTDGLHYAVVSVGTPSVSHFVALDTGSDLFWLPCECKACAPPSSPYFQGIPALNVYSPSKSNTSSAVNCSSTDCSTAFSVCQDLSLANSAQCEYQAVYGSPNTSSSGTVYQDDIHLTSNNGALTDIRSPILVGCGQTQTGVFVDGTTVPDGLLGLGREPFSVPSFLAKSGIVGDSFSICFATDDSGRIVFGDFGSANLSTTPIQDDPTSTYLRYDVELDSISINNDSIPVGGLILVDTGTTVTFLTTTVYQAVIASAAKQITKYQRTVFDGLFDLCYATSDANVEVPSIVFNFSGNAAFGPLIPFQAYFYSSNDSFAGFCLGYQDGGSLSILGANSMLGFKIVYNRKSLVLGFEASDCYSNTPATTLSPATSPAASPFMSPLTSPVSSPATIPGGRSPPIPILGPATATPGSGGVPTPPPPSGIGSSSSPRIPVSLLSVLSLGILLNFLFC